MATIALTSEQQLEVVKRVITDDLIELSLVPEKDAAICDEIQTLWCALEYYMNQKDRIRLLDTWPQLADVVL